MFYKGSNLFTQITQLTDRGEYGDALELIENQLEHDDKPTNEMLWLLYIETQLIIGNREYIDENFEKIQGKLTTEYHKMIFNTIIAIYNSMSGKLNVAEKQFDQARKFKDKLLDFSLPLFNYWVGFLYNSLGIYSIIRGITVDGKEWLEKAYEASVKSGNGRRIAGALDNLAIAHRYLGNIDNSIAYQKKVLKLRLDLGDKKGIGITKGNLTELNELLGNREEALKLAKEVVDIFQEVGSKDEVAQAIFNLGLIHFHMNEIQMAGKYFEDSLEIKKNVGNKNQIAVSLYFLVITSTKLDREEAAKRYLEELHLIVDEQYLVTELYYLLGQIQYRRKTGKDNQGTFQLIDQLTKKNQFDINLNYIAKIQKIKILSSLLENGEKSSIPELEYEINDLKKSLSSTQNRQIEIQIIILQANLHLIKGEINKGINLLNNAELLIRKANYPRLLEQIEAVRKKIDGKTITSKMKETAKSRSQAIGFNSLIDDIFSQLHGNKD